MSYFKQIFEKEERLRAVLPLFLAAQEAEERRKEELNRIAATLKYFDDEVARIKNPKMIFRDDNHGDYDRELLASALKYYSEQGDEADARATIETVIATAGAHLILAQIEYNLAKTELDRLN